MPTHPHARPQPALGIVRGRRITNRAIANHLDYSAQWVGLVLLGQGRPSDAFKEALSKFLGEPVEALFEQER